MSVAADLLSTLTATGTVTRTEAYRSTLLVLDAIRSLLEKVKLEAPPVETDLSLESDEYPMLVLRALRARYALRFRNETREAGRRPRGLQDAPDDGLASFVTNLTARVRGTPQARQEATLMSAMEGFAREPPRRRP
jgi:hypothetical protein